MTQYDPLWPAAVSRRRPPGPRPLRTLRGALARAGGPHIGRCVPLSLPRALRCLSDAALSLALSHSLALSRSPRSRRGCSVGPRFPSSPRRRAPPAAGRDVIPCGPLCFIRDCPYKVQRSAGTLTSFTARGQAPHGSTWRTTTTAARRCTQTRRSGSGSVASTKLQN